jgi:dihydroorotate dehydrogenase
MGRDFILIPCFENLARLLIDVMWRNFLRPLFFTLPPERAHEVAFAALRKLQRSRLLGRTLGVSKPPNDPRLKVRAFGLDFENPVGLAAGFDKDALLLPVWEKIGFGFAEIGTITPLAQEGNPRPRLFRLPEDQAIINRMGFNNRGAEEIRGRLLEDLRKGRWPRIKVGVNLGKNKATPLEKAFEDYALLLDQFLDLGDYFVVNVSSPNTPDLRKLQSKEFLDGIFENLQRRNYNRLKLDARPLLVKVAPDLEWSQLDDVLELCFKHRFSGIIATNTTLSREGLTRENKEAGGLSGKPLRDKSTEFISYIYKQTNGKLPIIGVGGIFNADDAWEKIKAGASLVQVYTGFIYEGPGIVRNICEGLLASLEREGYSHLSKAVGAAHRG